MEAAQGVIDSFKGPSRFTFLQKPTATFGFIALADILFYWERIGTTFGFFCLSLLGFILMMRADILRHRQAKMAAGAAGAFALVNGYDPSLLGFALFWLMLTLSVLLPRTASFGDGGTWAKRLAWHWLRTPLTPFIDRRRAAAVAKRPLGLRRSINLLALPLIGSVIFLLLFAQANPLIGQSLRSLHIGSVFGGVSFSRILLWLLVLVMIWSVLRPPRLLMPKSGIGGDVELVLPGVSTASVTLSLIAFNVLFALQNGLDLTFLWSSAALPDDMSLAEYAHRGAYPLIVTALLAALFVLVTLRPGTAMAQNPLVRRLVYAWIAQNVLLVASTILPTLDYVDAYSLTRLRIAALIWMGLVAVGLVLICVRIWKSKSGAWLINTNLAAALIALGFCSAADLGRMAAAWNVRHAREVGGSGATLDICYLRGLGASALLPMIELEGRTRNPILRERVGWARIDALEELTDRQRHWRGWTLLGALRLNAARADVARLRLPASYGGWHACDGPVPHQPLTLPKPR